MVSGGSKMSAGVGIRVMEPSFKISKSSGNSPTIYQAMETCAQNCFERVRTYILSAGKAALTALKSYTYDSKVACGLSKIQRKVKF